MKWVAQMPQPVIDRIVHYRSWEHANIHRGVHYLSETATAAYEHARSIAREFLNAGEDREVVELGEEGRPGEADDLEEQHEEDGIDCGRDEGGNRSGARRHRCLSGDRHYRDQHCG